MVEEGRHNHDLMRGGVLQYHGRRWGILHCGVGGFHLTVAAAGKTRQQLAGGLPKYSKDVTGRHKKLQKS